MVARLRTRCGSGVAVNSSVEFARWSDNGRRRLRVIRRHMAHRGRRCTLPCTQRTPGAVRRESNVAPAVSEQCVQCRLVQIRRSGFSGRDEGGLSTDGGLRAVIARRLAFHAPRAIFMPVLALAPAALGPLHRPRFTSGRPWAFGI
eukprot:6173680-Pleurochrysis_carterae.AAC.1